MKTRDAHAIGLEDPLDDHAVEMHMEIEQGAKAVDEGLMGASLMPPGHITLDFAWGFGLRWGASHGIRTVPAEALPNTDSACHVVSKEHS